MGRLHHLSETLPKNINWNSDYPNLEFVILDYNSSDGLAEWMKRYMLRFIDSGQVVYYKYYDSDYFRYSHSRNILIRLSCGDIICNMDADNYTGKGFAKYLVQKLIKTDFLTGAIINSDRIYPPRFDSITMGCFGRIAIKRDILLKIGGYNEAIEHWGYEDRDLYLRLRSLGYLSETLDPRFLFSIPHGDQERGYGSDNRALKIGTTHHKSNETKSLENIKNGRYILNDGMMGCGKVYKNFSTEPVIIKKLEQSEAAAF